MDGDGSVNFRKNDRTEVGRVLNKVAGGLEIWWGLLGGLDVDYMRVGYGSFSQQMFVL